ncbi:MAG: 16S rRNA (uracil(1498)-N(3))-methyltransferase [Bacteroidales bacterium]|nr:16S rRNA (uracil(1498)-N(3))-methyltransferase [Bacteroidales bacterium]
MNIFYTPDILSDNYTLNETESKHCVKVLKHKVNDLIYLIDGKGGFYTAKITDNNHKKIKFIVQKVIKEYNKSNFYLHIAMAPPKNISRFEWFLEKTTEIGIDEITPIICEHSERKIINIERLNKIIISAIKQSKKAYLPKLNEIEDYKTFINRSLSDTKYIAYCNETELKTLKSIYNNETKVLIMIGPEGDFSPTELLLAEKNKYEGISLGKSRLRTETAGIVACHTINLINQ